MLYHPHRVRPELFRHCVIEVIGDQFCSSRQIIGVAKEMLFEGPGIVCGRLEGYNLPSP